MRFFSSLPWEDGNALAHMMRDEKRKNENEKNDSFSPQNLTVMTFWAEKKPFYGNFFYDIVYSFNSQHMH